MKRYTFHASLISISLVTIMLPFPPLTQSIDTLFNTTNNCSGVILIARDQDILFKKEYGFASYECTLPNTKQSKFLISSITKPFTAMAIMQLQERGYISVHDSIQKFIPDFPNGEKITIHHLLTHTSGIYNYCQKWHDVMACDSLEAMVNRMKKWDLAYEPGSGYAYSNSGYTILAYIIELISKQTYMEFIKENIFKPLNIDHRFPITNTLALLGNDDLYYAIDDMYKWRSILSGMHSIVSQQSIDAMCFPHVMMEGSSTRGHGYGWFVDMVHGHRIVEYSGCLIGFLSKAIKIIDQNITIIILTNLTDEEQFLNICDGIMQMVIDYISKN